MGADEYKLRYLECRKLQSEIRKLQKQRKCSYFEMYKKYIKWEIYYHLHTLKQSNVVQENDMQNIKTR